MSNDQPQPEAVWYFPPKRSRRGAVILVIALSVVALLIAAGLLFFFISRGAPAPAPTESPTPSSTPTESANPTPSPTPTAVEPSEPSQTDEPVAPPDPPDPSLDAFAAEVGPRLDDAGTGLGYAADESGPSGVQLVEILLNDAEWLSDRAAPSSITSGWASATTSYIDRLAALRDAFQNGEDTTSALSSAQQSLTKLRELVGL